MPPIPSPSSDEKKSPKGKSAFISRCMSALKDENRPQDVKLGICYTAYKNAKKRAKGSEPTWDDFEGKDFIILP